MHGGSGIFANCVFTVSLTKDTREKKEVIEEIKRNGGNFTFGVTKSTTHLVTSRSEIAEQTFPVKVAYKSSDCWVVLPSFVFDSARAGKKEAEWLHTVIDNKPAVEFADDEEQFLQSCFRTALDNITNLAVGVNAVENSVVDGARNISAISIQLISKHVDNSTSLSDAPLQSLLPEMYSVLPEPSRRVQHKEEKSTFTGYSPKPSVFSSTRTTLKSQIGYPSSYTRSSFTSTGPTFAERAAQRRLEYDEKMQKLAAERQRKADEKRAKEEERLRQERERKEREDQLKLEELERKQKFEEEAKRRLTSIEAFDFLNYHGEVESEDEETKEENERKIREAAARKAKEEIKRIKKEKKKQKGQEFLAQKRIAQKEKKARHLEEESRKQQEAIALKAEKERRRREYAERQAKKKQIAAQGGSIQSATRPPPDDDRKLFIGGITFKDLDNKEKYPSQFQQETLQSIKHERIQHYFKILEQFGPVEKKKDYIMDKHHCFIVYKDRESFTRALQTLSKFEERERLCKEIKQQLITAGGKARKPFAPVPHFYVRAVKVLKGPKKS